MAIKLNGITKHRGNIFPAGVSIGFEDPHAEEYCKRLGWATNTDEAPVMTYPEGSFIVDPATVYADGDKKGALVFPELQETASEESAPVNEEA